MIPDRPRPPPPTYGPTPHDFRRIAPDLGRLAAGRASASLPAMSDRSRTLPARKSLLPASLLALALALSSALAAPAGAAELRLEGGTAVLRGAPGERNDLAVRADDFDPGAIQFSDVYDPDVDPALDCTKSGAMGWYFVSCQVAGIAAIRLEGGDLEDTVRAGEDMPFAGPIVLDGGPGNDKLQGPLRDRPVEIFGGDGEDEVLGGSGGDVIHGGPGNDRLDGGPGRDQVFGDEGDDNLAGGRPLEPDLLDGGAGGDTIDADWYDSNRPTNSVTVTLDGVADDGRPGEGDNVVGVETIKVRQAARLVAGADPVVFDVTGTQAGSTALVGSPGADRLRSYDYDDRIDGLGDDDSIEGGNGNDTIDPGPGRDSVVADAGPGSCNFLECRGVYGNDVILARDGEADTIECGPGNDRVVADPIDVLANCETVELPSGGGAGRPNPGGAATCKVPAVKPGATVASARQRLKKAGCQAAKKLVKARSRKVPRGRVLRLSAPAGRKTAQPVAIVVSRGRR
jgi:Ca2+-binding RTX toxin-like protein